ncbi:TonB-dependent receptor [Novosphingobium sp. PASSN1]|uniref:TonB-dependent receptor plug domain-containing protein n=1 Tax=Novosphingobium sp. PASSN1 TaxID=2015561 RepID=UPI0025EED3BE|nr:TonB-dependent receptor [Novosphingobium sp. PASSN1]
MRNLSNLALRGALMASAAAFAGVAAPQAAFAQQTAAATDDAAAAQSIVVIGTRRTDRTVADSASPIDVISAADLTTQPTANLLDSVRNLVPSFFVGQNSISDASTFVRAPSLRGLPGDQLLVMLNGKRYNRSALVQVYNGGDTGLSFGSQGPDISAIPAIAIKGLEVLRDGATAQYGSDAIAGVLNYGLRDNAGFEMVGRYGQFYAGDGESYQIAANGGLKSDRGFINISGEYNKDGRTSRGVTRPIAARFAAENPTLADKLPFYPLPAQIWGNSPSEGWKAVVNAGYDVTDNSQIYAFGNFAHSKAEQSFNFRSSYQGSSSFEYDDGSGTKKTGTIGGRNFFQVPYYQTQCPAGNPTCPAGGYVKDGNVFNLTSLYPGGFTPLFIGKTDQAIGTLGYKGKTDGGFTYDLSASLSRNQLDLSMDNSISPSFGKASQTSFEFGKLIQKEFDANLDLTYAVEAGLASPITFSGGAEFRRESYTATEGDFQSYGAGPYAIPHDLYAETAPGSGVFTQLEEQTASYDPAASGYGGTAPTYAGTNSQKSWGVYVGAEADITKQLTLGAAGRYEHYDSFGGRFVYKFNGIYHVTDELALRATVGSGFHAPTPGQNNAQVLTTNFLAGQSVQVGTFPVTSAVAQYFGAKNLKPETSTNFGFGFVFQPTSALTLTVDAYQIKVSDRIFISKSFVVSAADIANLSELASVGVGGNVQYFTNSLDIRTRGVDVVGSYRTDLAGGKLNLTLAYNYNKNKVTKFDPASIGLAQRVDAQNLAPKHRLNLQGNWTSGNFSIGAAGRYFGQWRAETDYPGQQFGAKVTADMDVSYTFMDNFTLTVGGNNIFNTKPDRVKASPSNPIYTLTNSTGDGQIYPRNGGPFGFNGGFWYIRARVKY